MSLVMVEEDLVWSTDVCTGFDKYFLDNSWHREEQTSPCTWREHRRCTTNRMDFDMKMIFVDWKRSKHRLLDWKDSFDQTHSLFQSSTNDWHAVVKMSFISLSLSRSDFFFFSLFWRWREKQKKKKKEKICIHRFATATRRVRRSFE